MNKYIEIKLNQLNYYTHIWLQVIQRILLVVLLFFVYFVVIGITKIIIIIFGAKISGLFKNNFSRNSFWDEPVGYGYDKIEKLKKQS
jgi:membrane-bound ClpP family serine protease